MPWIKTSLALLETIGAGREGMRGNRGSPIAATHKNSILYKTCSPEAKARLRAIGAHRCDAKSASKRDAARA
jgi:hypothetical protein